MDWETLFQQWETAIREKRDRERNRAEADASAGLRKTIAVLEWPLIQLATVGNENRRRTTFLCRVLRRRRWMPELLFAPMIRAAVYEVDPSFNRLFIEPCLIRFGQRRVNEELINYFESGSNFEKAGAANAFYWSRQNGPELNIPAEDIADLQDKIDRLLLIEFVANDDINVRRSIIAKMNLDAANYPEELRSLIPLSIDIARNHPDDHIRQRIELKLGNGGVFSALPHRSRDGE